MVFSIWILIIALAYWAGCVCHWVLSWWWGLHSHSAPAASLLGGCTCEAVIGRFKCPCGIILEMSGPTMSCCIWGYIVYPWGHDGRFPSLGFVTWHSPILRASACELVPCENGSYTVDCKSLIIIVISLGKKNKAKNYFSIRVFSFTF